MKASALMVTAVVLVMLGVPQGTSLLAQASVKYVKYEAAGKTAWGILENDTTIRELTGSPISTKATPTDKRLKLADVRLLPPAEPTKVIAAGLNYKSHIGEATAATYVGLFAKFPSTLTGHGADIIYPADATTVHYE